MQAMNVTRRVGGIVFLGLMTAGLFWANGVTFRWGRARPARQLTTDQESGPASPAPVPLSVRNPLSFAGCSASACHGSPSTSSLEAPPGNDAWKSSATHWLAVDPHRLAYQSLTGPAAARILSRL